MDLATICNSIDTAEEIHSILHSCGHSSVSRIDAHYEITVRYFGSGR
jgi:hypothetical protein